MNVSYANIIGTKFEIGVYINTLETTIGSFR